MGVFGKLIKKQPLFCIIVPSFSMCVSEIWFLIWESFPTIFCCLLRKSFSLLFCFKISLCSTVFPEMLCFVCFSSSTLSVIAALYAWMEAWREGGKSRVSILLSFSAACAKHPGTKPALLSFLLNWSSTSSKKARSGPKEGLRSVADNHTKWHYSGATLCYQLLESKLFNSAKGGSPV